MNILVTGIGYMNKGSVMMLMAIEDIVKGWDPSACIYVSVSQSLGRRSVGKLLRIGHYVKWPIKGRQWMGDAIDLMVGLVPQPMRGRLNVACEKDIDAVFDASGLVYSSKSSKLTADRRCGEYERFYSRGVPVVLLPQSFGPFDDENHRSAVIKMLGFCQLIMPRDRVSEKYVRDIMPDSSKIRRYPDFTTILHSEKISRVASKKNGIFYIVPNSRMIGDTSARVGEVYPIFIKDCINYLHSLDREVAFLIHGGIEDVEFADKINHSLDRRIHVIDEKDPLKIKRRIACSDGIVSSRFHAIVSALSSNVPAVVSGWSHKYDELLYDYDVPELMVDLSNYADIEKTAIDCLVCESKRKIIVEKLYVSSMDEKRKTVEMWEVVEDALRGLSAGL